eukprot:1130396-Amorphochlora_amoeboformis.AAC.1
MIYIWIELHDRPADPHHRQEITDRSPSNTQRHFKPILDIHKILPNVWNIQLLPRRPTPECPPKPVSTRITSAFTNEWRQGRRYLMHDLISVIQAYRHLRSKLYLQDMSIGMIFALRHLFWYP